MSSLWALSHLFWKLPGLPLLAGLGGSSPGVRCSDHALSHVPHNNWLASLPVLEAQRQEETKFDQHSDTDILYEGLEEMVGEHYGISTILIVFLSSWAPRLLSPTMLPPTAQNGTGMEKIHKYLELL